jgi:hypothetical protein
MIWLPAKEQKHRAPPKGFAEARIAQLKENKKAGFAPAFL